MPPPKPPAVCAHYLCTIVRPESAIHTFYAIVRPESVIHTVFAIVRPESVIHALFAIVRPESAIHAFSQGEQISKHGNLAMNSHDFFLNERIRIGVHLHE